VIQNVSQAQASFVREATEAQVQTARDLLNA
jgi:hypothetical protein